MLTEFDETEVSTPVKATETINIIIEFSAFE